jgi:hypothetical protein
MPDLSKTIFTLFSTDVTLQSLLGGTTTDKKFYPEVPQKFESFPCGVYHLISSVENSVPYLTQQNIYEFSWFSRDKDNLEDIVSRAKAIFRYHHQQTPRIFWTKKIMEMDLNETDRLLFRKILRYTVWSNVQG